MAKGTIEETAPRFDLDDPTTSIGALMRQCSRLCNGIYKHGEAAAQDLAAREGLELLLFNLSECKEVGYATSYGVFCSPRAKQIFVVFRGAKQFLWARCMPTHRHCRAQRKRKRAQ